MNLVNEVGRVVVVNDDDVPGLMQRGFTRPVLLRRHPKAPPGTALVARPYGGLGDMICLRPAVLQLAQREDLTLMVEERYLCLFPEIERKIPYPYDLAVTQHRYSYGTGAEFELAFENGFDERNYATVYDCWCPCGDHEFDHRYQPTQNRVENFAAHLGVAPRPPDMRPLVDFTYPHSTKKWVGLQVRTMHASKDWPVTSWQILAGRLEAEGYAVIVFDATETFYLTNTVVPCVGVDLMELGRTIGSLDAMIATDSGLMHYALALGVPTVGIFGPTDGALTMRAYDGHAPWVAVQAETNPHWGCHAPCYYSRPHNGYWCEGHRNSPKMGECLRYLGADAVFEAFQQVIRGGTDAPDQP